MAKEFTMHILLNPSQIGQKIILSHKPTQANSLFLCALVAPRTWEATDGISAVSPRESVAVAVEPAQLTGLVRTIYNNEI